jgi:tRNA (cmo5U34)-methyltransferase
MRDNLFGKKENDMKVFSFGKDTSKLFDDMLRRSSPHYSEIQEMICDIAVDFVRDNTDIYELGCSTGNLMDALLKKTGNRRVRVVGVDSSAAMLEKARLKLRKFAKSRYRLINRDLNDPGRIIKNTNIVISNLTLQFIRPINRKAVVGRIYEGLKKGGVFILVEKIIADDPAMQVLFTDLYHRFKARNGYSKTEILRKRLALENVLIPYTVKENVRLVKEAGFPVIEEFFRWYNFCGIVARK